MGSTSKGNGASTEDSTKSSKILYCVEFEVLKASKACRKEQVFNALKEGERICVKCESEALRKNLDWRCQGHGVAGRVTRWSAFSAPHCHGKWLRAQPEPSKECPAKNCPSNSTFIFV
ncbi:rpe-spondin [Holotrichia oblita]|uniref:Rpe-spondin n=1 Tax=Holotrichia oblita TaxID=644536 RepID=A0ACB9SKN0_HOLOL|nr:rpe-spondin [Holotrichia oblita]